MLSMRFPELSNVLQLFSLEDDTPVSKKLADCQQVPFFFFFSPSTQY